MVPCNVLQVSFFQQGSWTGSAPEVSPSPSHSGILCSFKPKQLLYFLSPSLKWSTVFLLTRFTFFNALMANQANIFLYMKSQYLAERKHLIQIVSGDIGLFLYTVITYSFSNTKFAVAFKIVKIVLLKIYRWYHNSTTIIELFRVNFRRAFSASHFYAEIKRD